MGYMWLNIQCNEFGEDVNLGSPGPDDDDDDGGACSGLCNQLDDGMDDGMDGLTSVHLPRI